MGGGCSASRSSGRGRGAPAGAWRAVLVRETAVAGDGAGSGDSLGELDGGSLALIGARLGLGGGQGAVDGDPQLPHRGWACGEHRHGRRGGEGQARAGSVLGGVAVASPRSGCARVGAQGALAPPGPRGWAEGKARGSWAASAMCWAERGGWAMRALLWRAREGERPVRPGRFSPRERKRDFSIYEQGDLKEIQIHTLKRARRNMREITKDWKRVATNSR